MPDKLLANEEFYEQLRTSMKEVEASREFDSTQEDPETYTRYSHHLGRAEFGTLKKRTSTRPSAATSRDPSGDRSNAQKSLGKSNSLQKCISVQLTKYFRSFTRYKWRQTGLGG